MSGGGPGASGAWGQPEPSGAEASERFGPEASRRWRLVLGRYADNALPNAPADANLDRTLGYLYDREYEARGHRHGSGGQGGTLDPSALRAIDWLGRAQKLFPRSTMERLERDALTRYGITDLLASPEAVSSVEANAALGLALLRMKGKLDPAAAEGLRALIKRVVDEIVERLRPPMTTAVTGVRQRHRRTPHASSRNFDWRGTIAANLANVDPETGRMLIEDVRFNARQRRRNLTWRVIVLVDQSGSMAASLLHSAVTAAILSGLPGVDVRLVLFDTSVVDLSHLAHDPVEVLLTAQLGGGTDIAQAMQFAQGLVSQPSRTVIALVSDFEEGGSVSSLVSTTKALAASGVRLLGLAALSDAGDPWYDHATAQRLVDAGMSVAAMTPDRFADWLAEVMT